MSEIRSRELDQRLASVSSPLEMRRIRPKKLHEMVAEELEEMILTGQFPRGHTLPPEREMINQFSVSRTVIRDAIRTLATKGLVDVKQGVGATVTANARHALMDSLRLTLRRGEYNLAEVFEVREILDVNIAVLAAQRATLDDINMLCEILNQWRDAAAVEPWEKTVKIHHDFHLMLIRATHNRVLMAFFHPITELLLISAQPAMPGPIALHDYQKHEEIFHAIRAHDEHSARMAMQKHFSADPQSV